MKVEIAYSDLCLSDYFRGDSRPLVVIYPTEKGYNRQKLREAILSEFKQGAIGGCDPAMCDFIPNEKDQQRADKFFGGALVACLNREVNYRGKRVKWEKEWGSIEDCESTPLLHVVFEIIS